MTNEKETVKWTAVGKTAVQFVNGQWGREYPCGSHREAVRIAKRLNEEENDYDSN